MMERAPSEIRRGVEEIHKVVCALLVVAIGAIAAVSAEDLAAAVKKRRDLMKKTVAPAAKLGGQMIKGVVPFDGTKAAKAMNDISSVPNKYVTLFPKGTEHGAIADSEALLKVWEDFDGFKALATKLKDTSAKAAGHGAGAGEHCEAQAERPRGDCRLSEDVAAAAGRGAEKEERRRQGRG